MTRGIYAALHLVPTALLIGAIGNWPYGYYTFLRFAVCLAAAALAGADYHRSKTIGPWVFVLGTGAVLFNPLIPIYLTRQIWFYLDLGMAAAFGAHLWAAPLRQGDGR